MGEGVSLVLKDVLAGTADTSVQLRTLTEIVVLQSQRIDQLSEQLGAVSQQMTQVVDDVDIGTAVQGQRMDVLTEQL